MAEVVRVDHIAFAVKDIEQAKQSLQKNLGARFVAQSENKEQKYVVAILQLGENVLSVVQATDESSFIAAHIKEHGEGVHHLGLEVDNIEQYVSQLEAKGVKVPVKQFKGEGRKEALVGPKYGMGAVLQLVEWKSGPRVTLEQRIERMKTFHG